MGYDEESAVVYVRFPDGRAWQYRNVPLQVWNDFLGAPSKGLFIKEVLNHYDHGPAEI
jgi:hypothetical protein